MSIISLQESLDYCGISDQYFTINAANDKMVFTSDKGSATIDITDGTYSGTDLATTLQTLMNANTTLTGTGTVTFAVSYSSTTYKFTINAGTGHTIALTYSGSLAALTLGFNDDAAAAQTITSNIATGDPTAIVQTILDGCDKWVKSYCGRDFESASYTEHKSGTGGQILNLDQWPITAVTRIAVGKRTVIRVKNTATNTTASVSVNSTGVVLEKDGVTDSTVTFATYTTMTTIVAAINALSGWVAELAISTYGSFKSTELVETYGRNAIDSTWVDLYMPEDAETDFEVYAERGQLYRAGGWPKGYRNIHSYYTAGYSSTTMPDDLKLAVMMLVKYFWDRRDQDTAGISRFSMAEVSAAFEDGPMPKEIAQILNKRAKVLI